MDAILDQGIAITQWIQSLGDWLTPISKFFSYLGSEYFFFLIAPAIYWCYDPILGIRTGIFLAINSGVNTTLKLLAHSPRPYWYSTEVKAFNAESSFGLPSGHAQTSVVVWGAIANFIRKKWAWILAVVLILFIGISRVHLGVHFASDVLTGWIAGVLLLWILIRWEMPFLNWFKRFRAPVQILFVLLLSLSIILLFALILLWVGEDAVLQTWIDTAALAAPDAEPIDPLSIASIVSYSGAFLGMAVGAIWISKKGWFDVRGTARQLAFRFLIGLTGVILLWIGLGSIFPSGQDLIPLLLRYIRYSLTGLWIIGAAPIVFEKLRLIDKAN